MYALKGQGERDGASIEQKFNRIFACPEKHISQYELFVVRFLLWAGAQNSLGIGPPPQWGPRERSFFRAARKGRAQLWPEMVGEKKEGVMKRALVGFFSATVMVAGATPFVAFAQAAAPTTPAPASQVTAQDAYAVAASTLAELRSTTAKLRGAIAGAKRGDKAAVKALEARLAATESGYTALKAAVEAGGDPAKLAKAHAGALLLLKGSKEALAAYEHLHIGVAGDLSGTAAGFKCPPGTAPRQKASSATLRGIGTSNDVTLECIALTGDIVVPEARSTTATAVGAADAARVKAAAEAAEAKRLPAGWRAARGVALSALGAAATYFVVGALSEKSAADRNGKVAGAVVGALGVGITLFEF